MAQKKEKTYKKITGFVALLFICFWGFKGSFTKWEDYFHTFLGFVGGFLLVYILSIYNRKQDKSEEF